MPRILLLATDEAVAGPFTVDSETQVVARPVPGLPGGFDSAHDWALADLASLAAGQNAETEGFDAVCLADSGDYGAGALRSVLSVPVLAAGRNAMLHALTLGSRFVVLAPASGYVRAKKLVQEYALTGQCAGVHTCSEPAGALATAQRAIDEDGADVVVAATQDAALAELLAQRLPVPVVDPVALGLKLAESFLGLGLSQSRRAWPEPQVRKPMLVTALVAAEGRL